MRFCRDVEGWKQKEERNPAVMLKHSPLVTSAARGRYNAPSPSAVTLGQGSGDMVGWTDH